MVYVFAAELSGLYDQDIYKSYYQKLPTWRKAKADRLKREDGKVQCVGAWALWQKIAEELGLASECVAESKGLVGGRRKKKVESEEEFLALSYVNLSHSGRYVLCAVDTRGCCKCVTEEGRNSAIDTRGCCKCVTEEGRNCTMVGCDIEKIGPLRLNLAKRNFCKEEYDHILSAGSEAEQTDLFYRYWVLKESFIKATREGIRRPMNSFRTVWKDGQAYKAEQFFYKEYELDGEYKVAVCATEDTFSDDIKVFYF